MRIRALVLPLLLFLLAETGNCQNFIPNWSFENYALCPTTRNDGRRSFSWDTPTQGTSDYFNTCASPMSQVSIPNNFAGSQLPRTGNAYAGFYASQNFADPFLEYREYMQVTMDSFLVAGGVYSLEFYVSLGDNSNFASNKIGAYISADKISSFTAGYLDYTPQVIASGFITDKSGWTKISGTYIAKGGEHYITIGVFEPAATNTRIAVTGGMINNPSFNGVSYYYLDDVSMTRACDIPKPLLPRDTLICAGSFSSFPLTANYTKADNYLWNTGSQDTSIIADTPGTYILRAQTPYCIVYDTLNVLYYLKPDVELGPDTAICNNILLLRAKSTSNTSFQWSNGSTDSVTFATSTGSYWVKTGVPVCYNSDTIRVTIINLAPFDLGPDTLMCTGNELALKIPNNSGARFRWNTGDSLNSIRVSIPGLYVGEVYSGSCSIKDSVLVHFEQTPEIHLGNDTTLCFNEPFMISASPSANYTWNDQSTNAFYEARQAGTYWVETRSAHCAARDTIVLMQQRVPAPDLGNDRFLCKETLLTMDAGTSGNRYNWNTGEQTQRISVHAPGMFFVRVTNSEGCYATDTLELDTFTSPVVFLGNDSFVCEGVTFTLDAGPFATYRWSDGSSQRTMEPSGAGTYAVAITDANGCSASDTVSLLYFRKPDLQLVRQLRLCEPDTLVTAVSSFNQFTWNDGSVSASQRITGYGTFSVTVTDTNSCTNTASVEVISTCPGTIFVPNAFTPANYDGINETFFPVVRNVKAIHMQIYTRWGELVYETFDEKNGWDGTYRNQPAQADVYVYQIDYTGLNGFTKTIAGNVTLLR